MDAAPPTMWNPEEDPVVAMLPLGEDDTASEAEARYLDAHLAEIVKLVNSPLSEEEFRRHPLIQMLFAYAGREWEDSIA